MKDYQMTVLELECGGTVLSIGLRVTGPYDPSVREPKIAVMFTNGTETRRLPLIIQAYYPAQSLNEFILFARYDYEISSLFYKTRANSTMRFWFEFIYGENERDKYPFALSSDLTLSENSLFKVSFQDAYIEINPKTQVIPSKTSSRCKVFGPLKRFFRFFWKLLMAIIAFALLPLFALEGLFASINCAARVPEANFGGFRYMVGHTAVRLSGLSRITLSASGLKFKLLKLSFQVFSLMPVKENRVAFLSNRRDDLTGNLDFVYQKLKGRTGLDIRFLLDQRNVQELGLWNVIRYGQYCATSRVILVDDYNIFLSILPRRKGTTMMQLWHACGAFKTFGFSRLGKPGWQSQASNAHRNYDYAIVSSKKIGKFYAEAFGLSMEKVLATGIPRTDVFFDKAYGNAAKAKFYQRYPGLQGKKIILFAPTFRGTGKLSGFYPVDKFDAVRMYEDLGKEYAILIKHHPFVKDRNVIPKEYQDEIIDLSDNSELNDLLFISNVLITDYSSVIFEAALLDLPMLFYAYDLQHYILERGFYYEYERFVPGKIVSAFTELIEAVKNNDFQQEKIKAFKTCFFDDLDGDSAQRVTDVILKML